MDDLLREFLTETHESLDVVDVELVRFEQDPNNAKILDNIFRLVHTIKGTCGFLGLPRLEALAHAAETLMGKFRDGLAVTGEAVTLVLATIDRIKSILETLEHEQREPAGSDDELIADLQRMVDRISGAAVQTQTVGTLVSQVLERPLRPGEDSLDDLERAFRQTAVERSAAKSAKPAVEFGRRRRQPGRQSVDPRRSRFTRAIDDHGLGAGAYAQPASGDRSPPRGFGIQGAAATTVQRHRRAAGRRDEDADAADRQRLAETPAHRARPRRRARQADRSRHAGCRNRA